MRTLWHWLNANRPAPDLAGMVAMALYTAALAGMVAVSVWWMP